MYKLLGDSYLKQLTNIRKVAERKKRDKERRGRDEAGSGDEDGDSLFKSVKKSQPDRSASYPSPIDLSPTCGVIVSAPLPTGHLC